MLFADSASPEQASGGSARDAGAAAELLAAYQYQTHRVSSPQEISEFVERFSSEWRKGTADTVPDPAAVLDLMSKRDRVLESAWTRYLAGDFPAVAIVSVVGRSNPFVVRAPGMPPLIVMCEGLAAFVFGLVLTAMLYAHEANEPEECLAVMRQFMLAWVMHDPARAPDGVTIQRLSTIDQDTTTFAVGISNAVLTWAFYHEVGHLRLGHLGAGTNMAHSSADRQVTAEIRSYQHAQEFEADRFGLDRYLELLAHEQELRREFEIGKQADHAPLIGFELMNLAYRLNPRYDRRSSKSHPAPLDRARALHQHGAPHFSPDGVDFYAYWRDLLAHVELGLRQLPI